jgi:pimeloyl-ACP methyl ester carboxylesterase
MQSRTLLQFGVMFGFVGIVSAQSARDINVPCGSPPNSVLVVGFLGGFERWDDPHRGVRKLALALQHRNLPNVYVATFENRHQSTAADIIRCFVRIAGGRSDSPQPRVILYGQSWGGAAVVHVAEELKNSGIRIQLTVQVDSVGIHDGLIPSNVQNAANLFQRDFFGIGGRARIQAQDEQATRILENTQLSYLFRPYSALNESDASWLRRTFGGSHTKMELDDAVWAHVQSLIVAAIANPL